MITPRDSMVALVPLSCICFVVAALLYLSVIATVKLITLRRLDRAVLAHSNILRKHSQRIAAILLVTAPPPPPDGDGTRSQDRPIPRRARVISIAREAQQDLDDDRAGRA